jgi:hypothetical protein
MPLDACVRNYENYLLNVERITTQSQSPGSYHHHHHHHRHIIILYEEKASLEK